MFGTSGLDYHAVLWLWFVLYCQAPEWKPNVLDFSLLYFGLNEKWRYRFQKTLRISRFEDLIKPEYMNIFDHQLSNCEIWTRPGCSSLVWPLWYRTLYSVYAIKFWQFVWPSIPIGMKSFQIFYFMNMRYFVV